MKEEKEEIINTLIANEIEERENEKAQREFEEQLRRTHEARATFQKVLADRNQKRKEQRELDVMFVQQVKANLEEEEKKEKEREMQKRMLRINDRRYNEQAIIQTIQKKEENKKLALLIHEMEEKEAERKAQMIEEERIRILKEHAPNLLGYFPKGCLKQRDLELLGITSNVPLPEDFPDVNIPKKKS